MQEGCSSKTLAGPGPAKHAQPALSVVLPNYNHGKWLGRAVRALASQAVSSMEILLVDDGSTDNSIEVIANLAREYECIRLIRHERNEGAHAAVRSGIAAARGEFMLFAAADDFVLPGLLSRGESALRAYPQAAFFCADVALLDRAGHVVGYRPVVPPRFDGGYVSPAAMRKCIRYTDNWFVGSSVVYRRSTLAEIGYFDESLGTLCDGMATRQLAFRHGFYFEPEVLAVWMIDPTTLSSQTSLSATESRRVLDVGLRCIADRFPEDVRDSYGALFRRRFAFNMARQQLLWLHGDAAPTAVCELLNCGPFERSMIHAMHRVPGFGRTLVLAAITLRLRPLSLRTLVRSWWRLHVLERKERSVLKRRLKQAFAVEGA